jgi:hypothetical protein
MVAMLPGMTMTLSIGSAAWNIAAKMRGSSDRLAIERTSCLAMMPPISKMALPIWRNRKRERANIPEASGS